MAKPAGKRERSADIAEVGALIFRRPGGDPPEAAGGAAREPERAPPHEPPHGPSHAPPRGPQHPAASERTERRTRRDVFDLDPRRIVERGPYIREWDESGEEFERLAAAVAARGEIDTPIWVRSEGPAGQRTFVLVAGKGRLRAALRNGLAAVPVRDLGELDDQQAVARQAEENLNRQDITPAETAHALWLMHGFGESVSDIGRRLHRDKGYVSYMVRVGEAVDALAPEERAGLAQRGVLQVRQCQAIGALPEVEARVKALRRVLATAARAARADGKAHGAADATASGASTREDEGRAFYGRATRGGRTFRMRWAERDLRADPVAVADGFVRAMREEREQLVEAFRRLEGQGGGEDVARARRILEEAMEA